MFLRIHIFLLYDVFLHSMLVKLLLDSKRDPLKLLSKGGHFHSCRESYVLINETNEAIEINETDQINEINEMNPTNSNCVLCVLERPQGAGVRKILRHYLTQSPQSSQRKARYVCDQSSETDEF